ncbi:hypothetical protein [Kitasatospora sp. MBT63]|uniref:hypothetical protein n=1 Tax=Kitasatospora sp. MBT63 TaxID=1444768 RepID=UPI00053A62B4|nr:hypothetical protein [Kitasatospora sp. MBT63]
MQITMLTLSASPEGVLEQGRTYDVPGDVARARAAELVDGGYARIIGAPKPKPKAEPKSAASDPGAGSLEKMTVEELQAYAAENDYDLGGVTKKADILAAVQAAETGG